MQRTERITSILGGSPDDRVAVWLENGRRETPLRQIIGIVRQEPTIHVLRLRTGVINLNPVLSAAVVIFDAGVVVRHELRDHQVGNR